MRIREMTPEEAAEFDRKHPLGTMLIMGARKTPSAKTQSSAESGAPIPRNPYVTPPDGTPPSNRPPSQEEIDANNRICEAIYRSVLADMKSKA